MREFEAIVAAYGLTADRFEKALADGDDLGAVKKLRQINDQAYFLILFAQFEELAKDQVAMRMDAAARSAGMTVIDGQIRALLSRTDWRARLALLTDMIGTDNHRLIEAMTHDRNKIAHGTLLTSGIDLMERATILRQVAALLTRESP